MTTLRNFCLFFAILAALPFVGCGSSTGAGSVEYSVSARENYARGVVSLDREEWIAAAKYFSFVKSRFPYSRFARLAEIGLADAEFGATNYLTAIEAYKAFIKFHPTHPKTREGYPHFQIARSYYKMLPDNFWLYPPAHEKDQSATYDAERELRRFIAKFTSSDEIPKAKKMLREVKQRLAKHEWYVANFYWERDRFLGTTLRLRRLLSQYGNAGYDARALWRLGEAYQKINMKDRARQAYSELVRRFPKDGKSKAARAKLSKLQ